MYDLNYFVFWGLVGLIGLAGIVIEIILFVAVVRWVVKTLKEAEEGRADTDKRQRASWLESKKRWEALSPEEKEKERKRQQEEEERWEWEEEQRRMHDPAEHLSEDRWKW